MGEVMGYQGLVKESVLTETLKTKFGNSLKLTTKSTDVKKQLLY